MKTFSVMGYLVLVALLLGCSTSHQITDSQPNAREPVWLRYWVNTEPQGCKIRAEGSVFLADKGYFRPITDAEIAAGKAETSTLLIEKPGYKTKAISLEALTLDAQTLDYLRKGGVYEYGGTVRLERDPSYEGPIVDKNRVRLTINSEPQGARVYYEGKLYGTTPLVLDYTIENENYRVGAMRIEPLIAVHEACLPGKQELEFQIDPKWRYESGHSHEYATLFLLTRDPNYRPPTIVQQQGEPRATSSESTVHMTVKQEKDALDILQQTGSIISIFQSLKPLR